MLPGYGLGPISQVSQQQKTWSAVLWKPHFAFVITSIIAAASEVTGAPSVIPVAGITRT